MVVKGFGFHSEWHPPVIWGSWSNLPFNRTTLAALLRLHWNGAMIKPVKPCRSVLQWWPTLHQDDSSDGGEKREDSEYILKGELTRFLDGLDVSCERKRRVKKDSGFGLSSCKDKVVINWDGEGCGKRKLCGKYQELSFGNVVWDTS